jgi:hypothetical protein
VTEVSNFLYDYCVRKKSETLELERTTYILPNVHNLSLCFVKVMSSVELIPAFEVMAIGIIYLSV